MSEPRAFLAGPARPTAPAPASSGWSRNHGLVALAVGYQWFYNGANFLAFKMSGEALHPLMVATLRFAVAGLIVLPFAIWRWRRRPATVRQLAAAGMLGLVMLVASQSLAIWGTHSLPAGVASVFGSAPPLFLALFAWILLHQPLAAANSAASRSASRDWR